MTSSFSTADAGPSARIGGTDPTVDHAPESTGAYRGGLPLRWIGHRPSPPMVRNWRNGAADQVVEVDWRTTRWKSSIYLF